MFNTITFPICFKYAIRRVQVNQNSLKLNGTHQLLVHADNNILGGSVRTTKKNTEVLVIPSKGVCLEVSADTSKYMVRSRDQNAGKNHNIKINNTLIERMEEFKYLGTTIMHQKTIQEKVTCRLKSGNICYHSAQNLLSPRLLSKTIKIKIYKTVISLFVLYDRLHGARNVI
jgi:hypothetical protein